MAARRAGIKVAVWNCYQTVSCIGSIGEEDDWGTPTGWVPGKARSKTETLVFGESSEEVVAPFLRSARAYHPCDPS